MSKEVEVTEQVETEVVVESTETTTEQQETEVDTNTYIEEIEGLKGQIESLKAELEGVDALKKANVDNSIKLELVKSGLSEDLFDLVQDVDVEVAKKKITKLLDMQKQQTIDNSYKPQSHKIDDAYSVAESKKDIKGMLRSKFDNFF